MFFGGLLMLVSCGETPNSPATYQSFDGETMGTYYRITHATGIRPLTKYWVDSVLFEINLAVSTYIDTSLISRFNQAEASLEEQEVTVPARAGIFQENIDLAASVYSRTQGYYDPTVMPLVNFWGFGYQPRPEAEILPDTQQIQALLDRIGFDRLQWRATSPWKLEKPRADMEIDLSASAKGFAIDYLSRQMKDTFGIQAYLIDIGGEARAQGVNEQGRTWRVGISNPSEDALNFDYNYILSLDNRAVATSGNYRNFYKVGDQTISHTMNPKTGFFERNNLLSVSIVTEHCGVADAFATACMAMGLKQARTLIESIEGLEALFIFVDEQGVQQSYITAGLEPMVTAAN